MSWTHIETCRELAHIEQVTGVGFGVVGLSMLAHPSALTSHMSMYMQTHTPCTTDFFTIQRPQDYPGTLEMPAKSRTSLYKDLLTAGQPHKPSMTEDSHARELHTIVTFQAPLDLKSFSN